MFFKENINVAYVICSMMLFVVTTGAPVDNEAASLGGTLGATHPEDDITLGNIPVENSENETEVSNQPKNITANDELGTEQIDNATVPSGGSVVDSYPQNDTMMNNTERNNQTGPSDNSDWMPYTSTYLQNDTMMNNTDKNNQTGPSDNSDWMPYTSTYPENDTVINTNGNHETYTDEYDSPELSTNSILDDPENYSDENDGSSEESFEKTTISILNDPEMNSDESDEAFTSSETSTDIFHEITESGSTEVYSIEYHDKIFGENGNEPYNEDVTTQSVISGNQGITEADSDIAATELTTQDALSPVEKVQVALQNTQDKLHELEDNFIVLNDRVQQLMNMSMVPMPMIGNEVGSNCRRSILSRTISIEKQNTYTTWYPQEEEEIEKWQLASVICAQNPGIDAVLETRTHRWLPDVIQYRCHCIGYVTMETHLQCGINVWECPRR